MSLLVRCIHFISVVILEVINPPLHVQIGFMGEQETFGTTAVSRLSEVLNNLTAPLDRITKLIRQRHKSIQDGNVLLF